MSTQNRLSYLLPKLIPTPGCRLLSGQRREWQVENRIPPSVLFVYWIFFSFSSPAFSDGLRILFTFMEVTAWKAKMRPEGRVGGGERGWHADSGTQRRLSSVVHHARLWPLWLLMLGWGVIRAPQRAADTGWNLSAMLAEGPWASFITELQQEPGI